MQFDPLTDYGQHNLKDSEHLLRWNFSELIKTLITLAAEPEKQMDIIGDAENPGEEMILDFESFYGLSAKKYVQAKLLRYDQAEALGVLGSELEQMDEESFSSDAIYESDAWQNVRHDAKHILQLLDMNDLDIQIEETENEEEKIGEQKRKAIQRRRVIVRK